MNGEIPTSPTLTSEQTSTLSNLVAEVPIIDPGPPLVFKSPPLPAKTTEQEDVTQAGQRRISLIWEITQSVIAIMVVLSNVIAALCNVFNKRDVDVPVILSSSLFMVLGFYLARTNHEKIGGVGPVPSSPYVGR